MLMKRLVQVEVQTLPLMVDCRPAGAAPHELSHAAANGAPPENHHNQVKCLIFFFVISL